MVGRRYSDFRHFGIFSFMTREDLNQICEDYDIELLCMDGFDDCIAGIVTRYCQDPIVCYDRKKVIAKLMKDGMTEEEAEEFFSFNQIGAWLGDKTPCFIET